MPVSKPNGDKVFQMNEMVDFQWGKPTAKQNAVKEGTVTKMHAAVAEAAQAVGKGKIVKG